MYDEGMYTLEELTEAKRQIDSTIQKLKKTVRTFKTKPNAYRYQPQITLANNRIVAFTIATELLDENINVVERLHAKEKAERKAARRKILRNIEKIHTTEFSAERIKNNLSLDTEDVDQWCKEMIECPGSEIESRGKNWYVRVENYIITINKNSYTLITAHLQ